MLVLWQNCVVYYMTDNIFPVTDPPSETHAPHWPPQSGGARTATGEMGKKEDGNC